MLALAPDLTIYMHLPPTDLRNSFDGPIDSLVRSAFQADPPDGSWARFLNHRRDRVRSWPGNRTNSRYGTSGWKPGRLRPCRRWRTARPGKSTRPS
jgi:hypothetical protein